MNKGFGVKKVVTKKAPRKGPGFKYTGSLRPGIQTPRRAVSNLPRGKGGVLHGGVCE